MPLSWKWRLALALIGVALLNHPGFAAKIERFKDKEGTLHISNSGEADPGKPGAAPNSSPTPAAPVQTFPQAEPPAAVAPPPVMEAPPPPEQETPPQEAPPPSEEPPGEPPGEQSAAGSQAQGAPAVATPPNRPPLPGSMQKRGRARPGLGMNPPGR